MDFFLGFIICAMAIAMIRYREGLGDIIGQADWMRKVGGNLGVIMIVSVLLFFFGIAKMTGTTNIFLAPLKFLLPFVGGSSGAAPSNTF